MVKGVSKRVIEVTNTGNKYFEKIVFYITPDYGNTSRGQLNQAATKLLSTYDFGSFEKNGLRVRHRKRKFIRNLVIASCCLAIICVIVTLIL